MDVQLIIQAIMGLVAILAILIFLLFIEPVKKPQNKKPAPKSKETVQEPNPVQKTDLESLVMIIKNKTSSADELSEALDLIIK